MIDIVEKYEELESVYQSITETDDLDALVDNIQNEAASVLQWIEEASTYLRIEKCNDNASKLKKLCDKITKEKATLEDIRQFNSLFEYTKEDVEYVLSEWSNELEEEEEEEEEEED